MRVPKCPARCVKRAAINPAAMVSAMPASTISTTPPPSATTSETAMRRPRSATPTRSTFFDAKRMPGPAFGPSDRKASAMPMRRASSMTGPP